MLISFKFQKKHCLGYKKLFICSHQFNYICNVTDFLIFQYIFIISSYVKTYNT